METIRITPLNVGKLRFTFSDAYDLPAGHAYAGQVTELPLLCYHIALPGRSVLVDAVRYNAEEIPARFLIPGYEPPPSLLAQLEVRQIDARKISDVIITHTHFDHYSGLGKVVDGRYTPTFPHARHHLNVMDWHPKQFGDLEERTLKVVQQHGLLNLVQGEVELSQELSILPAPGETPGHQIVCLEIVGQNRYFVGDLYHHSLEFAEPERNVRWASLKEMQASKATLMERAAADGGLVYFAHIEGSHRLERCGESLCWVQEKASN